MTLENSSHTQLMPSHYEGNSGTLGSVWKARGKCGVDTDHNTYVTDDFVDSLKRIASSEDEGAFRHVFNHFAPRVKSFLMRSGCEEAIAEEITQEAMATVWHKAALFDPSRASVSTWIFTIARNRLIDAKRKQKRPEPELLLNEPDHYPNQEDIFTLQQEATQLGKAISELPETQKEILIAAFYGDMSHMEVAEKTGLPLGTIKSRIRLALTRLRKTMT